jgi:hypothetical protein
MCDTPQAVGDPSVRVLGRWTTPLVESDRQMRIEARRTKNLSAGRRQIDSANSAPLMRNFNIILCRAADSGEGYNGPSQSVFQLGQIFLVRLLIIATILLLTNAANPPLLGVILRQNSMIWSRFKGRH